MAASFRETFSQYWRRPFTQEYMLHTLTEAWGRGSDPTYTPKPFAGRKYDLQSPLGMTSFYVFLVSGVVGLFAVRSIRRR